MLNGICKESTYIIVLFFTDLILFKYAFAGEVCTYTYMDTNTRERFANRYCTTGCCGSYGGFICCMRNTYYKYLRDERRQPAGTNVSIEAVAAIVTGSVVGLLVFIGIGVVLYIEYTRRIICVKRKKAPVLEDTNSTKKLLVKENQIKRILVVERNKDEINRNKYIETHDL
ncbi:Hypothetical predicted protein [Mytilus galloprovincialis]|uniref:Uncharacterized protein n=1 Tax=Mytilus galloprovincialis TaxID=29158 RepID=A0A8B6DTC3_MYTGA|nr:Hypothetical predicted protein [Mytilus galloprovincialis]